MSKGTAKNTKNKKTYKASKTTKNKKTKNNNLSKKVNFISKKLNKISSGIEVKEVTREGSFVMSGSGQTTLDQQIFLINPGTAAQDPKAIVIGQGDDESKRQGNQITTSSNVLKFAAMLLPWHATTNPDPKPVILKYWVLSIRGGTLGNTIYDIELICQTKFFESGASYYGFSDSVMDILRMVNDEVLYVHETKEFKLGAAYYMASGAGGATPTSNQGYTNNDFNYFVKWSIPLYKYTQKNIKWNDNDPQMYNRNKFVLFTIMNADGTAIGTRQPVELYYSHNYKFTDA